MKEKKNNEFWQNDQFIRDMLSSDDRSIEYWNQYLKEHPEKREVFEEACDDFKKIRLNNYSLSEKASKKILNSIHETYAIQKKKKYRYYLYGALAAACLIGVLFAIPVFYMNDSSNKQQTLAELPPIPLESIHSEVTLITNTLEKIEVEDNSVIACDSNLYVQNNQGQKKYLSQSTENIAEETVYNTLIVPRGKRSTLQLSDGSKVWVNAGSILKFPATFASDKRIIQVQGEIYIDVARNETKPFFVQTSKFMVNVLGTSFNVSAYSDEESHSVVLVKGQVAVKTEKAEEFNLIPNQQLTLNNGKGEVRPVDVYDHISWRDGILQFKGEAVSEVLKRLSRYYNVEIKCAPSVAERRCGGELILFDDIQQVLKTLSILYNVTYRFESETIIIE